MSHVEHHYELDGAAVTVHQVVCTHAEWLASGFTLVGGWSAAFTADGLVLASRLERSAVVADDGRRSHGQFVASLRN